jgi:hypothetical protein
MFTGWGIEIITTTKQQGELACTFVHRARAAEVLQLGHAIGLKGWFEL